MNSLTSQIIVNIIKQDMDLPDANVWIRDQNRTIPNDKGLYIVVGLVSAETVSNTVRMEERSANDITQEYQVSELQQSEQIMIDILSRSNDALTRNVEVLQALQCFYSQQQQELNNFRIFPNVRNFTNTSSAEGGSYLNRYSIIVQCLVWYRKEKVLSSPLGDYYDDFNTRVDDEKSIETDTPLFEFEINSEGIVP